MKALVTGGAGFIGSHLVELLQKEGHQVFVLDNLSSGKIENLPSHITLYQDDITNLDIDRYFEGIDWVFHLAGLTNLVASIDEPQNYFDVNTKGTLNVLGKARTHHVKRFIYSASASCYGNAENFPISEDARLDPSAPYSLTKLMGEQLVLHFAKVYKLSAVSLRLFNVYGPRFSQNGYSSVFSVFLNQKKQNLPLTIMGDGSQTRDFVYVKDVAKAFYMAAISQSQGVYNVGTGQEYTINSLAKFFSDKVTYLPKRTTESERSLADISKIKRDLKWFPEVNFETGVISLFQDQ